MHGEYQRRIRVGYQASKNTLRIGIPDQVRFPSDLAHVRLRDSSTAVISPNASKGSVQLRFHRNSTVPGCRELHWNEVKGIGPFFRMMVTSYQVEGQDLVIDIPDEAQRLLPKQYQKREHLGHGTITHPVVPPRPPHPAYLEDAEPVRIVGYGNDFTYHIPMDRMIKLIDELSRYRRD